MFIFGRIAPERSYLAIKGSRVSTCITRSMYHITTSIRCHVHRNYLRESDFQGELPITGPGADPRASVSEHLPVLSLG